MNQTITITFSLAELIPAITGTMIFAAVLISMNHQTPKYMRISWALGGSANLLLPTFGLITGNWTFTFHVPVAVAFAFVLCRSLLKSHREKKVVDEAQAIVSVGTGGKTS